MKKKLAWILVLAMVLSVFAIGCGPKEEASEGGEDVVKVGALFPFTGSLALLGEESFRGVELAREEINKNGGIWGGKKIEFVKGDAVDAKAAVAEAERLITVEGCKVIVGSYSSSIVQAASEVAERNGVIYWETGGVAEAITTRGFKNLFRVCPSSSEYGTVAVNYTNDEIAPALNVSPKDLRIAIIYEDGVYGTSVSQASKKRADELGLNIVACEAYSAKAADLSSLVMKLKNAKPDVILATQYATDLMLFWRQARELGLKADAFIGTGGATANTEFVDAIGIEDTNGVMDCAFGSTGSNPEYAKGMDHVYALYSEKYGKNPTSIYPVVGYVGGTLLWETLELAGEMDPAKIREAALSLDKPEGSTATGWGVKFAGPDEPNAGQNLRAGNILDQWQDGELVVLYPEKARKPGTKAIIPLPSWSK